MPLHVLERPAWYGEPKELGDLFRLTKKRRTARAAIWSHQFGWELRLVVGTQLETVRSQVCRSQHEVLATGDEWQAEMIKQGWRPIQLSESQTAHST